MPVQAITSPNTFSSMDVEAGLILKAVNKKLQMESVADDIFEQLGANIVSSGKSVAIPDAIFLKLEAAPQGSRTVTVPFLKALSGLPVTGAGTPAGAELKQNLKFATFKYAEYSQAVASEAWGVNANDMSVYGVFEEIQPAISLYMKELHGERIREALLQTHCSVLTTSGTETVSWNKNWFVANTDLGSQPAYGILPGDSNAVPPFAQEFTGNIIDVLNAAGDTVADGSEANVTLNFIRNAEYYAANVLKIKPIMIGGKESYVVTLPSTQVNRLTTNEAGQLGDIYTSMVRSDGDEMSYTGTIGRVGKCLLIEDQRYPTVISDGITLSPEYLQPGNSDGRNKAVYSASNKAWDIGFLLGKAALVEWEVKPLHFETETQNYGYNKGTGAFGESGISLVEYDIDTISETSRVNEGSMVLAMSTPAISA